MKKFVKVVLTILRYGWYGALTLFSGLMFMAVLLSVAEKVFKDNIVVGALALGVLIFGTVYIGEGIDARTEKKKDSKKE